MIGTAVFLELQTVDFVIDPGRVGIAGQLAARIESVSGAPFFPSRAGANTVAGSTPHTASARAAREDAEMYDGMMDPGGGEFDPRPDLRCARGPPPVSLPDTTPGCYNETEIPRDFAPAPPPSPSSSRTVP